MSKLTEKLIEARKKLIHMPKNGVHQLPRGGSYEYVLADDVLGMCQNVFNEVGIDFQPEIVDADITWYDSKSGNQMIHARVKASFIFWYGDESQMSMWVGEASDTSDKAIAKAMTSATKYFLIKKFLIPSGENFADPDFDGTTIPDRKAIKKTEAVEKIIENYWMPLVRRADKAGVEVTPLPEGINEPMLRTLYTELEKKVKEAEK